MRVVRYYASWLQHIDHDTLSSDVSDEESIDGSNAITGHHEFKTSEYSSYDSLDSADFFQIPKEQTARLSSFCETDEENLVTPRDSRLVQISNTQPQKISEPIFNDDLFTFAIQEPVTNDEESKKFSSDGIISDPLEIPGTSPDSVISASLHPIAYSQSKKKPKQATRPLGLFIQMELCNLTLQEWLDDRNSKLFKLEQNYNDTFLIDVLDCLFDILGGLDIIHSNSYIHRYVLVNS